MKNERYFGEALAILREKKLAPDHVLALSDDDLNGITLSLYNLCQEVAKERQVSVDFEFDDDVLKMAYESAHARDITLNQFFEDAFEKMIEQSTDNAQKRYLEHCLREKIPPMEWNMMTSDDQAFWYKFAADEDRK